MKTIIFEDERWLNLAPLALLRPVFELRCGVDTLREKILGGRPGSDCGYWVRDYLAPLARERYGDQVNEESMLGTDLFLVNGH